MSLIRNHSLLTGNYHPFYKNILTRAIGAGFNLPSRACMGLQNKLVKDLNKTVSGVSTTPWSRLDYLYIHAAQGCTEFTGINWITPTHPLTTFNYDTATGWVSKKGVHTNGTGTIMHGWRMDHRVKMVNEQDCSQHAMMGIAGSTITQVEYLVYIVNSSLNQTFRLRTTPQVDRLFNQSTAGPATVQSGLPIAQRLYSHDRSETAIGHAGAIYWNGVLQSEAVGGPTGNLPASENPPVRIQNVTSGRAVAVIAGGGGMRPNSVNHALPLYTCLNDYMNNLNLL